jgi:hypothetical protein
VAIDSISASLTLATVTTVGTVTTVTTVSTLTNQSQIGTIAANEHNTALMRMSANGLRDRISVTSGSIQCQPQTVPEKSLT